MFKKVKQHKPETVASLNKSISKSFFGKTKVKILAQIVKVKHFIRDYRLPSIASIGFVLLVLVFAIVRQFERTSLISLRSEIASAESGYSILLSEDEEDEFSRGDTNESGSNSSNQNNSGSISNDSQNNTDSFTVVDSGLVTNDGSSGGSSSGGGTSTGSDTSTGGGTTGGGDIGGGDINPEPTLPFAAEISSFNQLSPALECKNPSKPRKNQCSKVYTFNAAVKATNGPGTVNYSWQSSNVGSSGTGNFSAGTGSSTTTVSKTVTLPCTSTSSFTMQFSILSPSSGSSNIISVNHHCNEI